MVERGSIAARIAFWMRQSVLWLLVWGIVASHASASGAPLFGTSVSYAAGTSPDSLCTADFNGDNHPDLATANFGSNSVSVYLNDGSGAFALPVSFDVGTSPTCVLAARMDADGDEDLVVTNYTSNNLSILLNNGDGTFAPAVNYATGIQPMSAQAALLDADADIDLAVADYGNSSVRIYRNNGDGTFPAPSVLFAGNRNTSVFAANLDLDTDIDLAVVQYLDSQVSILRNLGGGNFSTPVAYGAGSLATTVTGADFDGDSFVDLASANYGGSNVSILTNNGNAFFSLHSNTPTGSNPINLVAADINRDHMVDLIVANHSGSVTVKRNLGAATFALEGTYTAASGTRGLCAVDLDGDVDIDFVTANEYANTITVFYNSLCPCDLIPPTSEADAPDVTQIGAPIVGTYTASDDPGGSGLSGVVLYVKEPVGDYWRVEGAVSGGVWSFTPLQTGSASDGLYRFATVAHDNSFNIEAEPTGNDPGDVAVTFNDAANTPLLQLPESDGVYTFPMDANSTVQVAVSGLTSPGSLSVSRTVGDVAPADIQASGLIDESISIVGSLPGGTSTVTWTFDPVSDNGLVGPLDTVFKYNSGTRSAQYSVAPSGETLVFGPVTSFSQFYAGNSIASEGEWLLYQ